MRTKTSCECVFVHDATLQSIIESNVSFVTHVFSMQSFGQTTHAIWLDSSNDVMEAAAMENTYAHAATWAR